MKTVCLYFNDFFSSFVSVKIEFKNGMNLNVNDEVGLLKTVVLGIANDFGGTPLESECYDPKSLESVQTGTYPTELNLIAEMEKFCSVLEKHEVEVIVNENIDGLNQIYTQEILHL